MNFDRTGIILYTFAYEECVRFYSEVLELKKLFETDMLTCFDFGGAYLMVEFDKDRSANDSTDSLHKMCLRMNVANVRHLADRLEKQNREFDYPEHSWGTVAKFLDPDGNLCAFKDTVTFNELVTGHNSDQ